MTQDEILERIKRSIDFTVDCHSPKHEGRSKKMIARKRRFNSLLNTTVVTFECTNCSNKVKLLVP